MAISSRETGDLGNQKQYPRPQPGVYQNEFSSRLISPSYPVLPSPMQRTPQIDSLKNIHAQETMVSRTSGPFSNSAASSVDVGQPPSARLVYQLYQDSPPTFPSLSSLFGSPESTSTMRHYSQRSSSIASSTSSFSSPRSHFTTTSSLTRNSGAQIQENWPINTSSSSVLGNGTSTHYLPGEEIVSSGYVPLQSPNPSQDCLPAPESTHLSQTFREKHPLYPFFHADLKPRTPTITSELERLSQSLLIVIQTYLGDEDLQRLRICNYNLYLLVNSRLAPDYTSNRIKDLIGREQKQIKDTEHWGCFSCYRLLGPEHFDSNTQPKYARITADPAIAPGVPGGYTLTPLNNIAPVYVPSPQPVSASTSLALFQDPAQRGRMSYIVNCLDCPYTRTPAHLGTSSRRGRRGKGVGEEVSQQAPIMIPADERLESAQRVVMNNPRSGDIVSLRRFCITCGVDSGLYPAGLRACITTRTGEQWFVCRCKIIWNLTAGKCHTCGLNAPYQTRAPGQEYGWEFEADIKEEEV